MLRPDNAPHRPLLAFRAGFTQLYGPGLPAGGQPADLPFITYEDDETSYGQWTLLAGRIWTREQTWGIVEDVFAQARAKIPNGGVTVLYAGKNGALRIARSDPFIGRLPPEDNDELNKAGVIRVIVENYIY